MYGCQYCVMMFLNEFHSIRTTRIVRSATCVRNVGGSELLRVPSVSEPEAIRIQSFQTTRVPGLAWAFPVSERDLRSYNSLHRRMNRDPHPAG